MNNNTEEITPEIVENDELTAKQELALRAVISHPTHKEAALAAGISEVTLWRHKKNKAFSRKLRETRRDAVNHAIIRLQQASGDAVTVLHNLMQDKDTPAAVRITAVRTVLDYSHRATEIDELKSRIDDLEEFLRIKQEYDEYHDDFDNRRV